MPHQPGTSQGTVPERAAPTRVISRLSRATSLSDAAPVGVVGDDVPAYATACGLSSRPRNSQNVQSSDQLGS
jgi:hypothetical protein